MRTLESYWLEVPVGRVAYVYGELPPQPFLFHESANAAFYISLDALNQFQKLDVIGGNPYVIPALGLWFLTAESYVSTIHKIIKADYRLAQRGSPSTARPKPRSYRKLADKYEAIEDYFAVQKPRPQTPISELREFLTLRNALFHDLTGVRRPSFKCTLFAPEVENVNEVDLLQGMIVSVGVFTYFRGLFPQADLMPWIQIGFAFDKLDTLAREVIFPAFREILAAKGLSTSLEMNLSNGRIAATARLPLRIFIKAGGPTAPKSSGGSQSICDRYLQGAIDRRPVAPDQFKIPDYARK